MKKMALGLTVLFMAFNLFAATKADNSASLLNGIRTTCTVAGGEWDNKTMSCYSAKKEIAGAVCGKKNLGVIMFAANNTKYCCQAYDVSKTGNQYSVHCDPIE